MREEYFESFLAILHQFPALKFNYLGTYFVCKFLKFIQTDSSTFIDNLRRLLQAHEDPSLFLSHLFSIPNVPDFDSIFDSIVRSNPNVNDLFIFQSIGESFSYINFDDLTVEEIQSIQQRNRRYILEYYRRRTSEFGPEFAHLCYNMSSPDYEDTLLTDEFLGKMVSFLNNGVVAELDAQSSAGYYIKILSLIAIKRGFPNLFNQLQSIIFGENEYFYDELLPNEYFQDEEMKRVVKDHPTFFASLPLNFFETFMGSNNPILFLKHKIFELDHIPIFSDNLERMTALVELETNAQTLKAELLDFANNNFNLLFRLFKNIINYSENPARTVHKVFLALKDFGQFEWKINSINAFLGTKTYLESLLKPENEDIFEFPNEGIVIIINHSTLKLFADFAKLMGTERISPLLKYIVIDWKNIVFSADL